MDLKKIKILALDLDGTTFTTDKRISQANQNAIAKAIQAGIYVIPATGRPLDGVPEAFRQIPGVRYALCSNGALVADLLTGEYLVQECMTGESVLAVMDTLKDVYCTLEIYMNGTAFTERKPMEDLKRLIPDPHILKYVIETRTIVPDLRAYFLKSGEQVEKINMSFSSVEEKCKAEAMLAAIPGITAVSGLPTNLEATRSDVDKGEGLLRFADFLGIARDCTAACGDSSNDAAMIQKSGTGVAVANADPEIKNIADLVLEKTNDEDAVAELIGQIL